MSSFVWHWNVLILSSVTQTNLLRSCESVPVTIQLAVRSGQCLSLPQSRLGPGMGPLRWPGPQPSAAHTKWKENFKSTQKMTWKVVSRTLTPYTRILPYLIQSSFLDAIASVGLPMSVCLSVIHTFFDGISVCNMRLWLTWLPIRVHDDQSEDIMRAWWHNLI